MRIRLAKFGDLQKKTARVMQALQLAPGEEACLAWDSVLALNEVLRGLGLLFPHKRTVVFWGAQAPPIDLMARGLSSEGYTVQWLPLDLKKALDGATVEAAFSSVKKDVLCVVSSLVEPLTGFFFPLADLREKLAEKNIPLVVFNGMDGHALGIEDLPLKPQSSHEIMVWDPFFDQRQGPAVIIRNERVKWDSFIWGEPTFDMMFTEALVEEIQHWRIASLLEDEKAQSLANAKYAKKTIDTFMAEQSIIGVRGLESSWRQLRDRVSVIVEGVNGNALSVRLAGERYDCISLDACSWDSPVLHPWLASLGVTATEIQSGILLPTKNKITKPLLGSLARHIQELRKLSGYLQS